MGFREGLEAFLIIAIMIKFISKADKSNLKKHIYTGAASGVLASLVFGGLLYYLTLLLKNQEKVANLWESIASIVALLLITFFILWMIKNSKNMTSEVESKMRNNFSKTGIFLLAFTVVVREGAEIAIFTFTGKYSLTSIVSGLLISLLLTLLIFFSLVKVNLSTLFSITLLYLILQAGFLLGYGIHEGLSALKEMNVLQSDSILLIKAFNLSDTVFNNKEGILGVPLYILFGWYSKPEWLQFIVQYIYTFTLGFIWFRSNTRKSKK
ncbi:MAG: FTR1 family protein [Clostridia bacterium]|nr:FTR1 family protein [Clostridia bacterium]